MIRIPILRAGKPYRSLTTSTLTDVRSGEPVAEVSLANSGLIARQLGCLDEAQRALASTSADELLSICRRAGELFMNAELPVGDARQGPAEYLEHLAATTGMPISLGRANMQKIQFVLDQMQVVLAGLTRGLDLAVLDSGWGLEGDRRVSFRRETDALGVILPSNSPGVHSLWIPAIALKIALVLKPGSQEPWTPLRVAQALLAAGCPPPALGFYPTDYSGAAEILLRSGRSMLFGDRATVEPWRGDSRVQIHGPGWSKVVLPPDGAARWPEYLDLMVESAVANGGRSCVNASGVWTVAHGRDIAESLADRFARIEARPLSDPEARLAALPSVEAAHRLSTHIDAQLARPGAVDLTAERRSGGRVVEIDGCAFLLPTVIYCEDPGHPLAAAEYLFPFVAVVELPRDRLLSGMGPTLVATALTEEVEMQRQLLAAPNLERLNLGPVPTSRVVWDQPHEGNLFDHLYRQRALQAPGLEALASAH